MNWNTTGLFDLSHTLAGDYLAGFTYPWQALDGIKELILSLGPALGEGYQERAPQVWVHETAKVAPTAYLGAPCMPSSGVPPWWGRAAWWATRWS